MFKAKVLTVKQIQKYIFNNASLPVVYRRLSKLYKSGLVRKESFYFSGCSRTHYGISKKGLDRVKFHLAYETDKVYRSDSILHDLTLNQIRYALESKAEVTEILSESELQSFSDLHSDNKLSSFVELNSDGVVQISKKNKQMYFALEYEANIKTSKRYMLKLIEYYKHKNVPGVFYIANKKIIKRVKNVEKRICEKQNLNYKFFYSTLEDVINKKEKILFINQNNLQIGIS